MKNKKVLVVVSLSFLSVMFCGVHPAFAKIKAKVSKNSASAEQPQTPAAQSAPAPAAPVAQQATPPPAAAPSDQDKKTPDGSAPAEIKKDLTAPAPVIEIKRLEAENPLYSIELRNVELSDLFRVIAHDYNLNVIMDKEVQGTITASFTNISLEECLSGIAEMNNLTLEKKGTIIRISPNLVTKTVILQFVQANKLLADAKTDAAAGTGKQESKIYDLLSDKGKLLVGKQPNSIIVIDYPSNVADIENYIKAIDRQVSTRVFRLKYLKASDVVGDASASGSASSTSTSSSTAGQ